MSDLIERVARAIAEGDWDQAPEGRAGQRMMQNADGTFRDINAPSRDEYRDTARAAIREVAAWINETGYSDSEHWADVLKSRLEEPK